VRTHELLADEAFTRSHPALAPGRYVALTVADTGSGMDAETLSHLFEPFFTTKPVGKGTGLGLATVYGIVQQSGGHVFVQSAPDKGTTFDVYFPCVDAPADEHGKKGEEPLARGTETVLLVEDEAVLRELVGEMLSSLGYAVVQAANGPDALRIAARSDAAIDLLLTDVVMPGMGGPELAATLGEARPGLHVLYMSGYTHDAMARHGVLESGVVLLQKPFEVATLARRIREALAAPPVVPSLVSPRGLRSR
jgi:CheY-like chemotaxis protein